MQFATPHRDRNHKWALPREYSEVKLVSISDHDRPAEVETAVETTVDYTATKLKPTPPKENAKAEQRPSFAGVELRKSVRKLDLGTPEKDPHDLPEEFAAAQSTLKKTTILVSVETPKQKEGTAYASAHLMPATSRVETPNQAQPSRRSSYTEVALKPLVKEPVVPYTEKYGLPDAFSALKLKKVDASRGAEMELCVEEAPDYLAVSLKPTVANDKKAEPPAQRPLLLETVQLKKVDLPKAVEVEVPVEEPPDYLAVPLKATARITTPKMEPRRASLFDTVQLKTSSHGEVVKSGGNIINEKREDPGRPSLTKELSIVQLKTKPRLPEVEVLLEERPDYGSGILRPTEPMKKMEVDLGRPCLTKELSTMKLKTVNDTPRKAEVVEIRKELPDYSTVQLKAAKPIEKDKVQPKPQGALYTEVHLKTLDDSPRKAEVEVLPEETPDYISVELKATQLEQQENTPKRAYYAEIQLKHTNLGDIVKEGGDVSTHSTLASEIAKFAAAQLRASSHGEAIKQGQDVPKEIQDLADGHALPKEFDSIQLKRPEPKEPEVEILKEEAPVYTDIPLKKTEPMVKLVPPRRASYTDIPLTATHQGDIIKAGKDVPGMYVETHFVLPEEFDIAHQKLRRPLPRAPEV